MIIGFFFPGDKLAGTWGWPLTSRFKPNLVHETTFLVPLYGSMPCTDITSSGTAIPSYCTGHRHYMYFLISPIIFFCIFLVPRAPKPKIRKASFWVKNRTKYFRIHRRRANLCVYLIIIRHEIIIECVAFISVFLLKKYVRQRIQALSRDIRTAGTCS